MTDEQNQPPVYQPKPRIGTYLRDFLEWDPEGGSRRRQKPNRASVEDDLIRLIREVVRQELDARG